MPCHALSSFFVVVLLVHHRVVGGGGIFIFFIFYFFSKITPRELMCVWMRRGVALKKDIKEKILCKVEEWRKREQRRRSFKKIVAKEGFEFEPRVRPECV